MGVSLSRWGGVILLATLVSSVGSTAFAQGQEAELEPLRQPTVPDVVDHNTDIGSYWDEAFTAGDAKFLFGIDYDDNQVNRDVRRIEAFYLDYLEQQDRDNPTVRTQDLPSPFDTSLHQLNTFE
jgi:hypothetical protein